MKKTVIHNGQVKQIDVKSIYEREKDMDDVDVEFHYFFKKDNLKNLIVNNKKTVIKFFIWLFFQYLAVKIEFGAFFFLLSVVYLMFTNLGKKQKGEISAYSVFNKNQQSILGSVNREQLESSIRHT